MKKIIQFLVANPVIFAIGSLVAYIFYGIVLGISLVPSGYLLYQAYRYLDFSQVPQFLLFFLCIGVSVYLFFITALLVFGLVERVLVIGFKPGRYSTKSFTFVRWLLYSGLHTFLLHFVLPYTTGTCWSKIFYRILGCKIGKNVFINTNGLHDAYLLELGDNVVIGGNTDISCHIFEGNELILGKIRIGSDTLIGTGCYIMPGAEIGNHCNIGIYSYVRKKKKIEDNSMIIAIPGLPAKQVVEIMKAKEK
ncbi:MAG: hypothetical protein J6M02_06365 [Clostridia bacterium]|nr:hypothetical protein [Clostridia bacterium]